MTQPGQEYLEMMSVIGQVEPGADIAWDEQHQAWLVGSLRAFREIAADPDLFQFYGGDPELAPEWLDNEFWIWFEGGPKKLPYLYGEQHERIHRWWIEQFGPRQVEDWRARVIRPLVHAQLDRFVERGSADLVSDLAMRIPLPVMLSITGLPAELAERYERVAHAFGAMRWKLLSTPDPSGELRRRARLVSLEMRDILMPFVDSRRSGRGSDLVSKLWRALPDLLEGECDDDAMYANLTTLFEAGVGTTAGAIGDVLYVLVQEPHYQRLLHEDSSRVAAFVEEALRLTMPALYIPRLVARDTDFHGVRLRRGDTVLAVGLATGRDPNQYACPHAIDLQRRALRGHAAFSFGPRHCAGHAVGRMEVQEVIAAVVERLDELRLDEHAPPPKRAGAGARRPWATLPVLFNARAVPSGGRPPTPAA